MGTKKIKLGIMFGGKSEEHEVSIMSARSVYNYADRNKYDIYPIAVDKKGNCLDNKKSSEVLNNEDLVEVPLQEKNEATGFKLLLKNDYDLIFPLIHGPYGEDGKIQGFLDLIGIPYVGTKVLGSAVGMDKGIMKSLFDYHNLRQTEFLIINKNFKYEDRLDQFIYKNKFPLFIKPANLGSSIGISKVNNYDKLDNALKTAFSYDDKVIIEQGIKAREIECAVLGKYEIKASVPGEIIPSHEFYDYKSKYQDETTKLIVPADLNEDISDKIRAIAIDAFKIINGEGLARVDFFLKENTIYINEINTIPGFTKYSMYPKLWEASGISYQSLIDNLIEIALNNV